MKCKFLKLNLNKKIGNVLFFTCFRGLEKKFTRNKKKKCSCDTELHIFTSYFTLSMITLILKLINQHRHFGFKESCVNFWKM